MYKDEHDEQEEQEEQEEELVNKWHFFMILLLILNLVVAYFFNYRSVEETENKINNLNSQINSITWTVDGMEDRLEDRIEQLLAEADNEISSFEYELISLDQENKTIATDFRISIKEKQAESEMVLIAENTQKDREVQLLENPSDLYYETTMDLDLTEAYSIYIIEKTNSGNLKQMNTREYSVDLRRDYYENRVMETYESGGADGKSAYFIKNLRITNYGFHDFDMESVQMVILYNDEVVVQEDITNQLYDFDELTDKELTLVNVGELIIERPSSFGGSSSMETAVAEEVMEEIKHKMENEKLSAEKEQIDQYAFQYVLIYDDYPELELSANDMSQLQCLLKVTFRDGYEEMVY